MLAAAAVARRGLRHLAAATPASLPRRAVHRASPANAATRCAVRAYSAYGDSGGGGGGGTSDGTRVRINKFRQDPDHWLNRVPNRVKIVEVGPRDGLQNEKQDVDTTTKRVLIEMLADAGLTVVEATSFVNPKAVPQMADAHELFTSIQKKEGVSYPVLVPNVRGLEQAIDAGAEEIAIFAAASQLFSQRNIGCSIEKSYERYADVVKLAEQEGLRIRGYVSCVLGCPYEGIVSSKRVADVSQRLHDMGCYEISLGDTIGIGNPGQATSVIRRVKEHVPVEMLAAHFHDTYGQALVNLLAVLQEGVAVVDSAVAGLGGCPFARGASGNVATEDVLYMLEGLGVETGVDLHRVAAAGHFISQKLGRNTSSRVAYNIARRRGDIKAPMAYVEILGATLLDGVLSVEEINMLRQYRLRHNISVSEHIGALEDLGWTEADFAKHGSGLR